MKNINGDIPVKNRVWKCLLSIFLALFFVFFVLPDVILIIITGFDFDAPAVDSCLDRGGRWLKEVRQCELPEGKR